MAELQLTPQCCGNCKHWFVSIRDSAGGECEVNHLLCSYGTGAKKRLPTTNLAFCTKWEQGNGADG